MSQLDFEPVKKDHCNFTFKAPKGMSDCSDLSVTRLDWGSQSTWKLKSLWSRIRFLFTGEISLLISGKGMPPVSLHCGDWVGRQLELKKN